ncbi:hypothetical protein [Scytonema sp. NUACC21]
MIPTQRELTISFASAFIASAQIAGLTILPIDWRLHKAQCLSGNRFVMMAGSIVPVYTIRIVMRPFGHGDNQTPERLV